MLIHKNTWYEVKGDIKICIRSDFREESGQNAYCVCQTGELVNERFITRYKVKAAKELRELFGAHKNEKIILKERPIYD